MPAIYRDSYTTLSRLLEEAGAGGSATLLIPDIQRPYVWTPKQVTLLVDSLLRGWPFGSLLLWSVANDHVAKMPWREFARVVDRTEDGDQQKVPKKNEPATYRMVLDGQQRVQSLLLAFGGDSWGFKMPDRSWHEAMRERRPRGRSASHWSVGELYLDLVGLRTELAAKKKMGAVDFAAGPLDWVVPSSTKSRSTKKRPATYEDPLPAADDPERAGRYVRLSRLWELAGDQGLHDATEFEEAVGKLLAEHNTPADLSATLQRPVEDLLRKLREVRETRVTFLEVDRYDAKMGAQPVYMEAVVNIFTRLNTAGRTLTREEITFAWVKSGWQPEKVGGRSASECFDELRQQLKEAGLDLSLDEVMAGIAFIWAVAFNGGKVLSQRDLLDAQAIRPMAQQLSDEWAGLERSVTTVARAIQQRGLEFGLHFQSLNALAVLWAWRFLAERWARERALKEVPRDAWEKQLAAAFGPLSDRWLVGSQWAGYWGYASVQRVADIASKLTQLRAETDALADREPAGAAFSNTLTGLVDGTVSEATGYVDRLSVEDRGQVRQYYAPLWIWHRLDEERWKMSAVPLRLGKKQPSWDVDHVVAVKLWETLPGPTTEDELEADGPTGGLNEIGNCVLLETAFNISKSAKPLGEWMQEIHEFKSGTLKRDDWAAALELPEMMIEPAGRPVKDVAVAVDNRTASIKQNLKDFLAGVRQRVDVK